jgi:hypothetical protein
MLLNKPLSTGFLRNYKLGFCDDQYVVTHSRYEKWLDGKLVMTEMESTSLRWFGVEEFKLLLESIGFAEVTVSSDYVFGKVPTHSKQVFTYEAIKN